MSFQITGPGFYKQRNGAKAEVFAERNGRWFGRSADGRAQAYTRFGTGTTIDTDLVAVWADPLPDPDKGWRLLEEHETVESSDEYRDVELTDHTWCTCTSLVGQTAGHWARKYPENGPIFRRRIPVFSVSDHGPGIYRTRNGEEKKVVCKYGAGWSRSATNSCFEWYNDGYLLSTKESPGDLVAYVGPLPSPEKVWVCTGESRFVRLEQKWICGSEVEWRAVPAVNK